MQERMFLWSAIAVIGLLGVIGLGYYVSSLGDCLDFSVSTVQTATHKISVGVADTQQTQSRGLGGCTEVPEDSGLYFPYDKPQDVSYWMKGMKIPIDIVWIYDGKVIGVEAFVPPPTGGLDEELPRYKPIRPVNAVLEVGAGKAKEYGLVFGQPVQFLP